ncbi:MAG: HD-GYP domain-containing protein [Planctomycetota bacterium]
MHTATSSNGTGATASGAANSPAGEPVADNCSSSGARYQRVLLVEDEDHVLTLLARILERAGFVVHATRTLADALQQLHRDDFHLVVSDLYLGAEVAHRLAHAADQLQPRVPVVLMTGRPTFDGAATALKHRVAEIVTKPIDPDALVQTCRRAIRDHHLRARNEELEAQNQVLAGVLPRAIEAKDPTTCGHAERVVQYADVLARRCGVGEADRRELRMAALLHDVGKIGIPDRILCKPGSLTPDEREVIQRHPQMGYDILAPLREYEQVRRWVYQHHERWDGKGYPDGLAGEDVALPGRILILAEVYDALAEERSYKKAWETARIVSLFREQAGRHFDPDLAHLVADGLEGHDKRFFETLQPRGDDGGATAQAMT